MKKFLLFVSSLFLAALLAAPVFGADIVQEGDLTATLRWTLDSEGVLTVCGTGAMPDYKRIVDTSTSPATFYSTAPWWDHYKDITSVNIEKVKN
ncbi:MAG: hypothetical protein K5981_03285 [Clostridia bacterium]|nr:hypothetical protein [Clostridia bacterium]